MKARILSAIIFDIENPIIHEKTCKKLIFQKKKIDFFQKKIFDQKFFKKNFMPPQIFFSPLVLNTKKDNYTKV